MIIDTTRSNINAIFSLHSGSTSNAFKLKGTYSLPTSIAFDPQQTGHGSCPGQNTCGRSNNIYYNHETAPFLSGVVIVNDDYYYTKVLIP